jgi:dolichol-phosphate mannosyltransferase
MTSTDGAAIRRVLSIVIPAYNEEAFIGTLLERISAVDLDQLGIEREILVVDDCSRDRTAEVAASFAGVRVHRQARNGGKGLAVRAGIALATGNYLIVQDADLEYDPEDYVPMLRALLDGGADIVYGTRYPDDPRRGTIANLLAGKRAGQGWTAYVGGRSLSVVAWAFTGRYLTDTVTALKLFPRADLVQLTLETTGFELDHEITAKMLARGRTIVEVPIKYFPRSREEGKKIGLKDWFRAVRTFWRFRRG